MPLSISSQKFGDFSLKGIESVAAFAASKNTDSIPLPSKGIRENKCL